VEPFRRFNRELTITQRRPISTSPRRPLRRPSGGRGQPDQHLAELDAARARIEITQTSVAAAGEDCGAAGALPLGASTIVDVLLSQEALNQAEVDVVNARFDYLRAKAQLEALIDEPLTSTLPNTRADGHAAGRCPPGCGDRYPQSQREYDMGARSCGRFEAWISPFARMSSWP